MTVEELKVLLEGNENADSIIEEFVSKETELEDVKSKRQVGVSAKDALSKIKSALGDIGYESGDVVDFIGDIKKKQQSSDKSKYEKATLEEKLNDLERKWEEAENKAKQLERETIVNKISSKLNDSISDKIYGSKYVIESLINSGRVDMVDGDILFKNGDDFISFDKGIESVLEENKDMLKVNQKSGANTSQGAHQQNKDLSELSVSDVLANIDNITKDMGIAI